ncbi:hypothetical protein SAMN05421690_100346 [Nitrosomonas sp. Nm51]|nr:hypothetical protein [Nitrosomonas sp. Nm51]SEQ89611.1 hypothetical protein SAMN05421690_100346 [Nitrosomonas sp. Nm51]
MKFTLFFAVLLSFVLIACGGPSAPPGPENTDSYGTTHEGAPVEGRNEVD